MEDDNSNKIQKLLFRKNMLENFQENKRFNVLIRDFVPFSLYLGEFQKEEDFILYKEKF